MTRVTSIFNSTVVTALLIGAGGTLITGVQPVLLTGLVDAGILNVKSLGWAATAEILGMAFGVAMGPKILGGHRPIPFVVAAALLMGFTNLVTVHHATTATVLVARSTAGVMEGILVAVAVLVMTYSSAPGRLNAAFMTIGAVPQLILAYVLPTIVLPRFGIAAAFVVMGGVGALCAALAFGLPQRLVAPGVAGPQRIVWTTAVVLSLTATFTTAAAMSACWSYADQLAGEIGLSAQQVGVAISGSLIFQVLGSALVAGVGWRLPFTNALLAGAVLQGGVIIALLASHSFLPFASALGAFGFLWQGTFPFATDLLIAVDPTRTSAPLVMPFTLLGLSAGPFVASFAVGTDVRGALYMSEVLFMVSALLYVATFCITARARSEITANG